MTYSEVVTYLTAILGDLSSILSFESTDYQIVVKDAMLDLVGYDGFVNYEAYIAAMTDDLRWFLVISKAYLWRYALGRATSKYNQSADGASLSRSQIYDMCKMNLSIIYNEMAEFDRSSRMLVYRVHGDENPYMYDPLRIERIESNEENSLLLEDDGSLLLG